MSEPTRNQRKRASRKLRGVKKKSTRTWVSFKQAVRNGQIVFVDLRATDAG